MNGPRALAWRRRKIPPAEIFQTLALVWAVFFVFAPGFGAEYLAWIDEVTRS